MLTFKKIPVFIDLLFFTCCLIKVLDYFNQIIFSICYLSSAENVSFHVCLNLYL